MEKQQQPILQTTTGGFSFSTLIAVFVGIFFIIVQVFILIQPLESRPNSMTIFLPGIAGLLIIGVSLFRGMRKGEISVFQNGIAFKKKNGQMLNLAMDDFEMPDLFTGKFMLRSAENQLLMLETPRERKAIGTVWMLKQYSDWPSEFWLPPFQAGNFSQAARHFIAESGKGVYCDMGFILEHDDQTWYLPTSGTVKMIGDLGQRERIYQRPSADMEIPLQFEPEPARLPMTWLCANILDTQLSNAEKTTFITTLVENHGGQICLPGENERLLEGECLGYKTNVILP